MAKSNIYLNAPKDFDYKSSKYDSYLIENNVATQDDIGGSDAKGTKQKLDEDQLNNLRNSGMILDIPNIEHKFILSKTKDEDAVVGFFGGVWGGQYNEFIHNNGNTKLKKNGVNIDLAEWGCCPIFKRSGDDPTKWGVYCIKGNTSNASRGKIAYLRYNNGNIEISEDSKKTWKIIIKNRTTVLIEIIGGGGAGGGGCKTQAVYVTNMGSGTGGGSATYLSACVNLKKFGILKIIVASGSKGGSAGYSSIDFSGQTYADMSGKASGIGDETFDCYVAKSGAYIKTFYSGNGVFVGGGSAGSPYGGSGAGSGFGGGVTGTWAEYDNKSGMSNIGVNLIQLIRGQGTANGSVHYGGVQIGPWGGKGKNGPDSKASLIDPVNGNRDFSRSGGQGISADGTWYVSETYGGAASVLGNGGRGGQYATNGYAGSWGAGGGGGCGTAWANSSSGAGGGPGLCIIH